MRTYFYIIVTIGMLGVLYLSWVSSPAIGKMAFMPSWISSWIDDYRYSAIRTAMPLVALGTLFGVYLSYEKKDVLWWYGSWVLLTALVVLAELGQFLRPMRHFDFRDIFWGLIGSGLGLQVVFMIKEVKNYLKKRH